MVAKQRPHLEEDIKRLTDEQRIPVDEFVRLVLGEFDSGNVWSTVEVCINMTTLASVKEVVALHE